ncbi:hypothetical protein [Mesorhizobium sp. 1M-11]|uniref:hypothetical protein n=1 Tax=Mesorhizobium sp. 1M-11 TaxID=1529006 RepID=UPI0006C76D07|nr:hypothetical protein [Mesorhizobium sp. 1M-11]
MWPKLLNSYRSVLELRDFARITRSSKPQKQLRAAARIAVIDDEKFQAFSNLTSYGYNITELPDLRSVSEVENFDIVLCDLMGVGNNFDKSIGGASIIGEIKRNYPTKFVVAYSGARANSNESAAAREVADEFIKKDADISKWVERLDEIIHTVVDPYQMWLVARQGLIDNEIDIRRIIELEDAYVRSIANKDKDFSYVKKTLGKIDLGGNAKAIVQGLISSAIFALVFS